MLPEITQLLKLQERDQRIRQLQKDLKEIPRLDAQARAQLAGDQASVENAHQSVQAIEVKIKGLQLDIQTRQNSIKRLHDQQFETRKNDEFRALGTEIERYQRDVSGIEDKEIEQMEALEGAKVDHKEAQAKLAITQSHVNDDLKALAERAEGMKKRLAEVEAERSELVAPVEPSILDVYTRLFSKKPDAAVVPLEHGICKGCHMKLVSATVQALRSGQGVVQCENCGRILYLVE